MNVWLRFDGADALLAAIAVLNTVICIGGAIGGRIDIEAACGWLVASILWLRIWAMCRAVAA